MRNKSASVARHVIGGGVLGGVGGALTGSQISDGTGVEAEWPWQESTPDGDYTGEGAAIGAVAGGLLGRYTGGLSKALKGSRLDVQKGKEVLKKQKEQGASALKQEKEQGASALNAYKEKFTEVSARITKIEEKTQNLKATHAAEIKRIKAGAGDPEKLRQLEQEIHRQKYYRMETEHALNAHRTDGDMLAQLGYLEKELPVVSSDLKYYKASGDQQKVTELQAQIEKLTKQKKDIVSSYKKTQEENLAASKKQLDQYAKSNDINFSILNDSPHRGVQVTTYDPYGGLEAYGAQMGSARFWRPFGVRRPTHWYSSIIPRPKLASLNAPAPEDYVKLAYAYGSLRAKSAAISNSDSLDRRRFR